MSQQLAIIVMIDINAALAANTLEGNIYLFDNMKTHGSSGEGTGDLITAVNGSHWYDGGIAAEQVLNWLPYGVGTLPRTLPRGFQADQSRTIDKNLLQRLKKSQGLKSLSDNLKGAKKGAELKIDQTTADIQTLAGHLSGIADDTSVVRKVRDRQGNVKSTELKMVDITGEPVKKQDMSAIYMTPIINEITGEAVDKGIIYPDQYGSPDLVNDGWYWAATVNTGITGIYGYTMHITLFRYDDVDETWTPVEFTYTSYINVTSEPKVNGFTQGAMDTLPV